jgi:hypothetical protein
MPVRPVFMIVFTFAEKGAMRPCFIPWTPEADTKSPGPPAGRDECFFNSQSLCDTVRGDVKVPAKADQSNGREADLNRES